MTGSLFHCDGDIAAELCKKLRQEQSQMRDEAEQLTSEIKSLEADVRYSTIASFLTLTPDPQHILRHVISTQCVVCENSTAFYFRHC